jgi:hypothetical protein
MMGLTLKYLGPSLVCHFNKSPLKAQLWRFKVSHLAHAPLVDVFKPVNSHLQLNYVYYFVCLSYPSSQQFLQTCSSHEGQPNLDALHAFFLCSPFIAFCSSVGLAFIFLRHILQYSQPLSKLTRLVVHPF